MAFTEVTSESWFSRLGKSFVGIFAGIVLFLVALGFLWWNEGNFVKVRAGLIEAQGVTISLPGPKVDSANEGKMVHFSGMAKPAETLQDPEFEVEADAIQLQRKVEMYQWQENSKSETRDKLGGGTETTTTYSYSKTWSDQVIESSGFKESGHDNPASFPGVTSQTWKAEEVTIGEFSLSERLISEFDKFTPLNAPVPAPAGYTPQGQTLYKSANPSSPQIGDIRITFQAAMPAEASIVAVQTGNTLTPFLATSGTQVELFAYGTQTAESMYHTEQTANTLVTWLFRAGGLIALIVACSLVLAPIGVLASVIPFLGSIARFGTFLLSLVIAIPVALLTIALAWIAYRPVFAYSLLAIAVIVPTVLLLMKKKKPLPAGDPRVA